MSSEDGTKSSDSHASAAETSEVTAMIPHIRDKMMGEKLYIASLSLETKRSPDLRFKLFDPEKHHF